MISYLRAQRRAARQRADDAGTRLLSVTKDLARRELPYMNIAKQLSGR